MKNIRQTLEHLGMISIKTCDTRASRHEGEKTTCLAACGSFSPSPAKALSHLSPTPRALSRPGAHTRSFANVMPRVMPHHQSRMATSRLTKQPSGEKVETARARAMKEGGRGGEGVADECEQADRTPQHKSGLARAQLCATPWLKAHAHTRIFRSLPTESERAKQTEKGEKNKREKQTEKGEKNMSSRRC